MPFGTPDGELFDTIEEFTNHLRERYKQRPWHYKVRAWSRRQKHSVDAQRNTIKWGWQRFRRGYSDSDVWNLGPWLAYMMPLALRELGSKLNGWPGDPMTFEEWEVIIEKIALAFEEAHNASSEFREIDDVVYNEGMDLFKKYLMHLWD